MVAQAKALTPDAQAIRADLEYMTARWHELPVPAVFEVRAFKENAQPQTARFKPEWMSEAVDWIENLNSLGFNTYCTRNPIRADVTGSAKDEDVIAAFFLWADCDDPTAAGNIYRFDGPKWTAAVTTGRTPSVRVHTYWALDVPCTDLAEWRRVQEDIAAHFASDRSVVNPSRIMRIGGTINHPFKRKQDRGYIPELCTINTTYDQPRSPVSLDQMRRAFGARPEPERSQTGADSAPAFNIDTGPRGKTIDELTALVRGASTDGQKHTSVRDLAGHLAGTGVKRETCEAIIRNVCPVWDRNVEKLINDAYAWADAQGIGSSPQALQTDQTGAVTGLKVLSSREFLSDLEPAVYVVDGVLAKKRCLSITGYAGHGKTTLALHLAIQVATGREFGGAECEKGSVLVLAGENPDNVKWQYAAAVAAGGKGDDLPIYFLPGHFQLSAFLEDLLEKARAIPDLKLVVIDSLQAFFEGDSDNGNVEMIEAARRFRALSEIESGPAVLVIAHPAGKKPDKGNIVPRGGSAFGNEFDGNLTVWAEPDGTQTFHHTEKFRGSPFEPMHFVMEDKEFEHLKDHKGRSMRLKVSRQQLLIEQANAATKSERREKDALGVLDADPKISIRALAERLAVSKSTADRIMQTLRDEKLIRRHAKKWLLTDGGKEVLDGE